MYSAGILPLSLLHSALPLQTLAHIVCGLAVLVSGVGDLCSGRGLTISVTAPGDVIEGSNTIRACSSMPMMVLL